MDIEIADHAPIRQATLDDLTRVFAGELEPRMELVRNYGDRLAATTDGNGVRLAYYEAVTGHWQEATEPLSRVQVKDAFFDYFQGNWNWHQRHAWRTM